MNPVALRIGPVSIYWYGILVSLSFLVGYLITLNNAKRYGLDSEAVDALLFKVAVAVLIGARLGSVLTNLPYYLANPAQIIRLDHGGLGSHGAIITAMILGYVWTRQSGIPYWTVGDALSPVFPIAHVFVRLGNFINGELYGPPTDLPWGVKFSTTAVPVHPSQLYEVIASLIILPFALQWARQPRYPGYAFLRVLLVHSVVRFLLDFIRQHSELIGPFVLTQIIALIFVILISGYIYFLERKNP